MITTLFWDHDGVLVDTEGLYFQATREVLATHGVDLTVELYRQLFLVEARGAWHLIADGTLDATAVEQLRARRSARYKELLLSRDVMVPGALSLLARLGARFRMAIVTSSHREHFEAIHQTTGLPAHFEFILAREDYAQSKPDPEPYLTALARTGCRPHECLVLEDSERGLRAALSAGLRCWVVPSELTRGSSFAGAERRFADLSELGHALMTV